LAFGLIFDPFYSALAFRIEYLALALRIELGLEGLVLGQLLLITSATPTLTG